MLENATEPFHNAKKEIIGCIILFTFIALSNAGGLSGAGSIIPIMLIFYDLHMFEAVPVSAFVAVCATCFRFLINFNQQHPNAPKRVAINYEVVEITMPFVFLGSFYGVQLGHMVGEIVQVVIFGLSVTWSIKTTVKKARELIAKERQTSDDYQMEQPADMEEAAMEEKMDGEMEGGEDMAPEMMEE